MTCSVSSPLASEEAEITEKADHHRGTKHTKKEYLLRALRGSAVKALSVCSVHFLPQRMRVNRSRALR
jgi:hypothetical protein